MFLNQIELLRLYYIYLRTNNGDYLKTAKFEDNYKQILDNIHIYQIRILFVNPSDKYNI